LCLCLKGQITTVRSRSIELTRVCRKRILLKGSFTPPEGLISLWAPLLSHIQSLHPAFPSVLVSEIVSRLLSDPSTGSQLNVPDHSYEMCLASWVVFLLRKSDTDDPDPDDDAPTTRNVVITLLNNLGPVPGSISADRRA
jgi:ribosomal biogenesis protein LAS1